MLFNENDRKNWPKWAFRSRFSILGQAPSYKLKLLGTLICPPSETCFRSEYLHKIDNSYNNESALFNEYLFSFKLKAGTYNVHALRSRYESIFVGADAIVPLDLKAEIKPNSVIYLGHINAILREKKSNEEEQAGLWPPIDASAIGFTTGTFDVIVEDRFDEDMEHFTTEYPGLLKIDVQKIILPQWIRPEKRKSN